MQRRKKSSPSNDEEGSLWSRSEQTHSVAKGEGRQGDRSFIDPECKGYTFIVMDENLIVNVFSPT
jgi:hypothetical protein